MPLWLGFALFGAAAQSGPMTVDEAVQAALRNGYSVLISETRVKRNQAAVAEATGQLGPKANLGATYTRFAKQTTATFNGNTIVTSPIDSKAVNASVTLPIDINGSLHHQVGAARANLRAAQENFAATGNDIKLNVRSAFFQVLRAQQLVKVQQQALADAQEQLKNTQLLEQGGVAAHVDVLRVQSQVQQAQADLIAAQNALAIANANFNAALARPIDTPVDLIDVPALPAQPTDEAKLREGAHARRPEARSILKVREALAETRKAVAAGLLPTLGLSLNMSHNFNAGAFSAASSGSGTLAFSWPLFDSGVTRARAEEIRQDEQQATLQYNQLLESISQEVRQAMANLTNAFERLDVATKQVTFSEENLRLARLRYQAGEGILLQVTDAETQLTQARNQYVSARYDYLTAYSQLQHALGTDDVSAAQAAPTPTKESKQ